MVSPGGIAYVVPVVLSAALTAALGAYAWRRQGEPAATAFSAVMATATVWSAAYAVGLVTTNPGMRRFWLAVEWLAIPVMPVAWLGFAFAYAGWGDLLTRRRVAALSVLPAVTVALAWTNSLHSLVWRTNDVVLEGGVVLLEQTFGAWFLVYLVYAYALVAVGTGVLLTPVVGDDPLYADQSVALVVGAVVPWVANALSTLGLAPLPGLDTTPYAFAVTGLGFGLALFRYELLDVVPALRDLGRDVAITDLQDGVLVLDRDRRVRDLNPAAEAMVGAAREDLLGEPVGRVLGVDPIAHDGEAATAPPGTNPSGGADRVTFPSPDGRRTLEASVSPVYDRHGRVIAYTLVVRDVTERETREQRLAVLNRVLRHNVRNDLSVVTVYANHLSEQVPEAERDVVERIEQQASGLVDVAQKARQAEDLMAGVEPDGRTVDVGRVVEDVCDLVRSRYPACAVAADGVETTAELDRSVLEQVLLDLVENAAEHNDAADPRVEVTAERFAEDGEPWLRLRVADNGPGLPDHERAAIVAGSEDPLRHGSSIGLWLVNWGVDRLGGRLTFADNDPRGTVATVEVPG
jgi:PAS domain S-box-containing protein